MSDYKPATRTTIIMFVSMMVFVIPAMGLATYCYVLFLIHGLHVDMNARPEGFWDRLVMLTTMLPMILLMALSVFIAGIPWMFLMSRFLSLPDIEYFSRQKARRIPLITGWLEASWNRMIQARHDRDRSRDEP